ncbi:hypothetical protein [Niallia taxi]|uniref:hypothetical protein n=1 Tax=Niallia taxi TaxID=2499688 RepID=UPI002E1EE05B|nr:hypothetical protein [Niallia taxi]
MSKQLVGKILAILGALALMINISFFKEMEWYYIARRISLAVFFVGILLIPTYAPAKNKDQHQ